MVLASVNSNLQQAPLEDGVFQQVVRTPVFLFAAGDSQPPPTAALTPPKGCIKMCQL